MAVMEFPHCDQRILHPPGECRYCDEHPDWQELRQKWGIAFTGQLPGVVSASGHRSMGKMTATERSFTVFLPPGDHRAPLPCPADFNRPPTDEAGDHRRWAGNVATSEEPVNETAASRMLYGCHRPPPGWVCSRQVGHEGPCAASPIEEAVDESRRRPGFIERMRGNIERHRDLLDRLK